jgi:hypothetical protein
VIVEGSIASLNVALAAALRATSGSVSTGLVEVTVGAALSGPAPLVKLQVKALPNGFPARSSAPVVIFAVKTELIARALLGVKVAVVPIVV